MAQTRQQHCYQCETHLPRVPRFHVTIDGTKHYVCCPGCQSVAEALLAVGIKKHPAHIFDQEEANP